MAKNSKRTIRIEELPDRVEHMRKIGLIRKFEHPQYAADDPTRTVNRSDGGARLSDLVTGNFALRGEW